MNASQTAIAVSFVIPMYNEADIVRTAIARVGEAGRALGRPYEVVAVDDGSSDETPRILAELRSTEPCMRWVQLRPNCGQPASSKAGLLAANGDMVVVLDADMQTPPEIVPAMVSALEKAAPDVGAVFGVTSTEHRDDPARLMAGQAVFYFLETRLGRRPMPHGASSFFVMRRDVAQRLGRLNFTKGNVGAVMSALDLRMEAVPYVKPASYRDDSRLGLRGHVEEAVGSLALTGVLSRVGGLGAVLGGALGASLLGRSRPVGVGLLGLATVSALGTAAAEIFIRRSLRPAAVALPMFEGESAANSPV